MTHTLPLDSRTKLTCWLGLVAVACLTSLAVAPAALAAQAPKNVVHRHFLKLYKVEKVVDVEGEETVSASVACDEHDSSHDDDIATDGMWKIVDVDQNDSGGRNYTAVRVLEARSNPTDPAKYDFQFYNTEEERAQLKIYVTCLGYKTAPNSHQHTWTVSSPFTRSLTFGAEVGTRQDIDTNAGTCAGDPTSIAVSPGFVWTGGGYGHLTRSEPTDPLLKDRSWSFWITDAGTGTVSVRCLTLASSNNATPFTHYHKVLWSFAPAFSAPISSVAKDSVETRVRACDEHEKLMVHSFDLDPAAPFAHDIWFLGMDPRIKKRAYKVQNKDLANPHDAQFGGICFNDRTSRRIKP